MATPPDIVRRQLARVARRRRAMRARLAGVAMAAGIAWAAKAAQAGGESMPLGAPTALPAAGGGASEVVRVVVALAVVVGLALAAKWWVSRSGIASRWKGNGAFEVVARHPMGRGQAVLVARFGPRVLCLQQSRDGLRTLAEISDPAEVAGVLRGSPSASTSEVTVDLRRSTGASG